MSVIPVYPEAVPIEILNTAILTAPQKADWVEIMIALLATAPAQKLTELGPDVRLCSSKCILFVMIIVRVLGSTKSAFRYFSRMFRHHSLWNLST